MLKPAVVFAVAALVARAAGRRPADRRLAAAVGGLVLRGRWSPALGPAAAPDHGDGAGRRTRRCRRGWAGCASSPTRRAGWAAVHDTAAKTLTAHLQIAGTGFTTLAPDQMELLLSGWGAVFSACRRRGAGRITWSDVARRMPLVGHCRLGRRARPAAGGDVDEYRAFVADTAADAPRPGRHRDVATAARCAATTRSGRRWPGCGRRRPIVRDALGEARLSAFGPLPAGELGLPAAGRARPDRRRAGRRGPPRVAGAASRARPGRGGRSDARTRCRPASVEVDAVVPPRRSGSSRGRRCRSRPTGSTRCSAPPTSTR